MRLRALCMQVAVVVGPATGISACGAATALDVPAVDGGANDDAGADDAGDEPSAACERRRDRVRIEFATAGRPACACPDCTLFLEGRVSEASGKRVVIGDTTITIDAQGIDLSSIPIGALVRVQVYQDGKKCLVAIGNRSHIADAGNPVSSGDETYLFAADGFPSYPSGAIGVTMQPLDCIEDPPTFCGIDSYALRFQGNTDPRYVDVPMGGDGRWVVSTGHQEQRLHAHTLRAFIDESCTQEFAWWVVAEP